jgi:hypothetical protein
VDDLPFTVPLVFPDAILLEQESDSLQALRSLSLRTSDNLLSAVRLEMSLQCVDPFRLIRSFGFQQLQKEQSQVRAVKIGPANADATSSAAATTSSASTGSARTPRGRG